MIVGIQQTHGTLEVDDAIVATSENTFVIHQARICIEPLAERHVSRAEKLADVITKSWVIGAAAYLVAEVIRAWNTGAFNRLVHQ